MSQFSPSFSVEKQIFVGPILYRYWLYRKTERCCYNDYTIQYCMIMTCFGETCNFNQARMVNNTYIITEICKLHSSKSHFKGRYSETIFKKRLSRTVSRESMQIVFMLRCCQEQQPSRSCYISECVPAAGHRGGRALQCWWRYSLGQGLYLRMLAEF